MSHHKYIVFGASGGIGRLVSKLAKAQGSEVVAVLRKPEQAQEFEDKDINTVIFDISTASPDAYATLLQDTKPDVVVWAAGVSEKDPKPHIIERDAQIKVYDAMGKAGVRRAVIISSPGVWQNGIPPPDWLSGKDKQAIIEFRNWVPKINDAKLEAELYLRAKKDIDWTILRPAYLDDSPARGVEMGHVSYTALLTSREDVAQVALGVTDVKGMFGRTIDFISGDGKVKDEIEKAVREDIDTWVGPG